MSRATRFATAARFLVRSLELRGGNFLLALVAVIVGVSVTALAVNLRADVGRKLAHELRAYGPNLLVTSSDGQPVDEAVARRLVTDAPQAAPMEVVPLLYALGSLGDAGVTVVGTDFASAARLFAYWRLEGAWPDVVGESQCLAGTRLVARLGVVRGGRLRLVVGGAPPVDLTVSGVVTTGEDEDEELFIALPLLQRLTGRTGRVTVAAVRVQGGAGAVDAVTRAVEAGGRGLSARPLRQVAEAEGRLLDRLDFMMTLLGGLILVVSTLCVMTTLMSVVIQRGPEIGLMRSLGAGDGDIVRMLLGEATVLGGAGGLLGFALGALDARLLGRRLFGTAIATRMEALPVVLLLAVAVCWAGVWVPLRRALAIQPAEVLRGE